MESKLFFLIASIVGSAGLLITESAPPIVCNLKSLTPEQRKQMGEIGRHVISAITKSRELNDGYMFRVDAAKAALVDVARWLDLWRRCCPFYDFRIDFHAADTTVWLSVTGRKGVKEYIAIDVPQLAAKLSK